MTISILTEDLKLLQDFYFRKNLSEYSVRLLRGGFSRARNYRIENDGKLYFARFMPVDYPMAIREKECLITDYAGRIGIGPEVYYQDPQQGIIITEFISGRTANHHDMTNDPIMGMIVENIRKLHQSTRIVFPKANTIGYQIQSTFARANSDILQEQLQQLKLSAPLGLLSHWEKNLVPNALIHGDFNNKNIMVGDKRVYIVDWTNAGAGDEFADISWHAFYFPLTSHNRLLCYYFKQTDSRFRRKLLCHYFLRMLLTSAWGVEQAKILSGDSDQLLPGIMKQPDLPEPCQLSVDISRDKFTFERPDDFIFSTAVVLHYLTQLVKTDDFLSAIEEIKPHA